MRRSKQINPLQLEWRYIFNLTLMIAAYVFLGLASGNIVSPDTQASTIWLPAGMTLAVVLIGGYRYLLGIVLGVVVMGNVHDYALLPSTFVGMSNALTIFIAVYLLKSVLKTNLRLQRVRDLVELVFVGGLGGMFVGAIIGTIFAALNTPYTPEELFKQFIVLWVGTTLAIIFITPTLLVWYHDRIIGSRRSIIEIIALICVTIILSWFTFTNVLQVNTSVHIFYFVLPPLIWAIARFRLREVTLINAITVGVMLWGAQSSTGIFNRLLPNEQLIVMWSVIGIGSLIGFSIKILVNERNEIQLTLRKERDAKAQILDNLGQAVTVITQDGLYEYVNPAFGELVGQDHQSIIGQSPYEIVGESFKTDLDHISALRKTGESASYRALLKHRDGHEVAVMTTGVPRIIDGEYQGSISVLTDMRPIEKAQAAQQQSEAELRQLFENTDVGMYRSKPGGKPVAINQKLADLSGYPSPEAFLENAENTDYQFYVNPDRWKEFQTRLQRDGSLTDFESEVYHHTSKEKFWVTESAYAVYDDDDEMLYYDGVVIDITARKHIEQKLQRSEAFFRTIFEHTADAIGVIDTSNRIMMSNRAFQNLVGYSAQELGQLRITDYILPDDAHHMGRLFEQALDNKQESYKVELHCIRKDGEILLIAASIGLVWDDEGRYAYAIGICRDVTEARAIQLALTHDERRFRSIFENASLPIAVTSEDRKIGMVNRAFSQLMGYTSDEMAEMQFDEITYPGDNDENMRLFKQLINREIDNFTITKRYVHKEGHAIWANISVSRFDAPISDEEGKVYTIAIIENITERKLAEDRLLAEMQLNEQLIDALPGIFYFFDQDGNFLRWNKELERVSGLSTEKMTNYQPIHIFPIEARQRALREIETVFTEGYAVAELPILRPGGKTSLYLMNGYRMMYNDQPCLLGVGIDITGLKQAETALRESEERYRSIFENTLVGMYRSTTDGRFLAINPALIELLGYDNEQELYELDIARDVYANADERVTQMQKVIEIDDLDSEHLVKLRKKDGTEIMVGNRARAIYDDDGNVIYFEGSIRDVTEKHRYDEEVKRLNKDLERRIIEATRELREKNEKLLELDRLRAKFIADMSHEMRTPLAVLNTRLYLLKKSNDPSNLSSHIDGLQLQINRLSEFVENAFDLSVIDMSRHNIMFDEVALNNIIEQAVRALHPRAAVAGLVLDFHPDPLLPTIVGVESHLSQVVTNLVGNAIKYTSDGSITVTTGRDSITKRVYLRVEDTGMGIAREDKEYLFSRFYRGERAGQSTIPGTGLGLSIVKEIVDAHNGHIDIESEVDEGSIFTVWLPIERLPQPSLAVIEADTDATTGE